MSNYLESYYDAARIGRPLTAKQRRRMNKKANRDLRHGAAVNAGAVNPGNQTAPAPLSGHPGRRRAQLAERLAVATDRAIARALRKQAAESAA